MDERSMRNINLALRFILEIIVLVALFVWGTSMSDEWVIGLVLGLGAPLIGMTVWGLFVAPKAARRLADPSRLAVELAVFGAGVVAFVLTSHLFLGILLGTAVIINVTLMFIWGQRGR